MVKNLSKLIAVLAVLTILLLLKTAVLPRLQTQESGYTQITKDIDKGTLSAITLEKKDEKVQLIKEGQQWKVEGKRAQQTKVEQLIEGLTKPTGVQLVAQTDARHSELGVVTGEGTLMTLGERKFIAGAPSISGVYIRAEKNNDVYLLSALSSSTISTSVSFWMDMALFAYTGDELNSVVITRGKEIINAEKKDGKWTLQTSGKEVKEDIWNPILARLGNFSADSLAQNDTIQKYPTFANLTLSLAASGKSETLTFFKGTSDYLVKRDSDGAYFTLSEEKVKDFLVTANQLE